MRNILKVSSIIGVFVFGVAVGVLGNAIALNWNPYCPQPDKSAVPAALVVNPVSLGLKSKRSGLPDAVERKIFRRVERWIDAGCPGAFTWKGVRRVWNLSPITESGVGGRMQKEALSVGYTLDSIFRACQNSKEAHEARAREASQNKKWGRLFVSLNQIDNRLDRLERNRR